MAALPKGKRFMSEAGSRKVLEQQIEGPDLVMRHLPPARLVMGFALSGGLFWRSNCRIPIPFTGAVAAAPGSFIDMDARTTFAYAANKMDRLPLSDPRPFCAIKAMWQALGIGSREVPV